MRRTKNLGVYKKNTGLRGSVNSKKKPDGTTRRASETGLPLSSTSHHTHSKEKAESCPTKCSKYAVA